MKWVMLIGGVLVGVVVLVAVVGAMLPVRHVAARTARVGRPPAEVFALVHHEQHWAFLEYALWDNYGTAVPRHVLTHQGVPIVSVYGRRPSPGEPTAPPHLRAERAPAGPPLPRGTEVPRVAPLRAAARRHWSRRA